jgi:hypothetical protein
MPTVLRIGPYRFYFFSHEPYEPMHVHVDREKFTAKFWLEPIQLAKNIGFKAEEINKIEKMVRENELKIKEAWNGYFRKNVR